MEENNDFSSSSHSAAKNACCRKCDPNNYSAKLYFPYERKTIIIFM